MDTRVFRLCTTADKAAFQARATEVLRAWAGEWLGPGVDIAVACEAAEAAALEDADGNGGWVYCDGPGGSVWAAAAQARNVASSMFGGGSAPEAGLAAAVGHDALACLVERLAAGSDARLTPEAPVHLGEPGRATLRVTIGVGAGLTLWIEPPPRERRAPARLGPLATATGALHRQTVTVDVWLGQTELELGALQTLAVGDVLRLAKKLDEGVELRLNDERLPCVGYLGAVDGRVAIEVARR